MSSYSTRYFQLTPDILIEYSYATETGDECRVNVNSMGDNYIIENENPYIKFYMIDEESTHKNGINLGASNFVIPTNKSETTFIKLKKSKLPTKTNQKVSENGVDYKYFSYGDTVSSSIYFDKLRFHFTGKDFFGEYESLIIQAYVFNKAKQKLGLMSFIFSRTDNIVINQAPMMINQRYYVSYFDIKLPSTYMLLKQYDERGRYTNDAYTTLMREFEISGGVNEMMINTPISFNLYGVRYSLEKDGNTYYKTENISSVTIPSKDIYDDVYVDIDEANDGDYFEIKVKVSDGTSFSDYIYNLDERPDAYIILHELSLIEHYVSLDNKIIDEVTHTEQFIINGYVEDGDDYDINENNLDKTMLYRPVCKYGSMCFKFTIEDNLKIINIHDNTIMVKRGTLTYENPAKYGKKMNQINLTETPPTINVFNKRTDMDVDMDLNMIKITNGDGGSFGPRIETTTQNITSFVESANILVSIQQIPANLVEWTD